MGSPTVLPDVNRQLNDPRHGGLGEPVPSLPAFGIVAGHEDPGPSSLTEKRVAFGDDKSDSGNLSSSGKNRKKLPYGIIFAKKGQYWLK